MDSQNHVLTTDCMGVHIDHLVDHLEALLSQESSPGYQAKDYLEVLDSSGQVRQPHRKKRKRSETYHPALGNWEMNARDRWQIAQWFYSSESLSSSFDVPSILTCLRSSVISDFRFPREFAMIAMDYLDRYLSRCTTKPTSKEQVELLALSCFYLAVKLFQAGPVLSTHQMSVLSGRFYTAKQISWTEQKILFTLGWKLHPPCPADYVRPFVLLLMSNDVLDAFEPANYDTLDVANSLLHSAVLDYYFVAHKLPASHVAAAAILNAVQIVQSSLPWHPDATEILQVLTDYANIDVATIQQCQDRLWYISEPTPSPHQQQPLLMVSNSFDDSASLEEVDATVGNSPNCVMRVVRTVRDTAKADFQPPYYG